jgi:beta-glucosidase/6-phospho-beta-glucosidase/beta-galactosidase
LNLTCDSQTLKKIPLEKADDYFNQLKQKGTTLVNLELAWETIEYEGQGIYNEAYLAYLRKIILAAQKEGISVSINFCRNIPAWAKETDSETMQNHFAAACQHAQRRLKNCTNLTVVR